MKIQRLEESKGLFSDLNKGYKNEGQNQSNNVSSTLGFENNNSVSNFKGNNGNNNSNNNKNGNNKEIKKLKNDLKSCRNANKELESIKDNYKRITSSPKKDLFIPIPNLLFNSR